MFASAAKNATLDTELRNDKNVFFLHLLGLDTTGHAYRPYSKEYLHNIKVVDQGVKEMTRIIEDFYGDGKTAFVFTADHGISDWGSHGDGHPDNTRTPLIAWGSGVAKPVVNVSGKAIGHEDGFSSDWGLDNIQRHDVNQADIAALMAYLAGLDYPVNSVGELPLSYLSGNQREKAEAILVNAQGVLEMYRVKEQQKKASEIRFKPFPPLEDEQKSIENHIQDIRQIIKNGEYGDAIQRSQALLHLGLDGLRYLQTYDWLFLRALVTVGYLGWIAFALTTVIDLHVLHGKTKTSRSGSTTVFFGAISAALFSLLVARKAPFTYYLYAVFPPFFWEEVVARQESLFSGSKALFGGNWSRSGWVIFVLQACAFLGVLEALVCFPFSDYASEADFFSKVLSYFHRIVYTACFILASFWPAFYGRGFVMQNRILIATWFVACQSMSIFTLLNAIKVENSNLM